jgi:NAD(P)-dependent dehydrogenase (short-subunit alcohol dehydrogenase family)
MARAAAKAGMNVVVADISEQNAVQVAEELIAMGVQSMAVKTDVSNLQSVEDLAAQAYDKFGAVHLLCNNAGVWIGAMMAKADIKDWQWVINVNLYGVIHGVTTFLPKMLQQGEGHIVNTASMGGLIAGPPEGLYCTTKFAVVGLTEALFMEVADKGIGVSLLCPGLVKTALLASDKVRPTELKTGVNHDVELLKIDSGIDPDDVGQRVLDAVESNEFYIITHTDYREYIKMRGDGIIEAMDKHSIKYSR